MKKKYYSWFVASMLMLAAASCSEEEVVDSSSSKEMTTFKVSLEGQSQSRAAGEGERVSKLYYEVYQNGRKVLDNYGEDANADPVAIVNGAAIVEMPIMRGEKYDLMFWAEADNSIYDATDLKSIKVDYSKTDANQEAYDAFFYGEQGFKATSNETTIELRRPFGQLNVGTTVADWETAKEMIVSGDPVTASQLKLTGLANRFNVLTHVASVDGEVGEVTFKKAALINETFSVTESAEYQNLSMNYLLVPTNGENSHKANVNITAVSFWREGEKELFSLNVPNVPVQRNWRTNILGDLLAADKTFEIVICPIFDGERDYPETMEEKLRMAAAIGGTVTLTEDVTLSQTLEVKYDMTINLNGKNITVANESTDVAMGDAIISYARLTINGEGTVTGNTRAVWARGNNSVVTLNGGTYKGATKAETEVIYASGNGVINIYDGTYEAVKQAMTAFAKPQYAVLNLHGNGKDGADINVYGGSFKNFNPTDNVSENPAAGYHNGNFVAEGYEVDEVKDGEDTWYQVTTEVTDIVIHDTYAEVYTVEGLLKWAYTVNKQADKKSYGMKLMRDIEIPAFTIEEDVTNGTYVFTETGITVDEDGVPSGSNWMPICVGYTDKDWDNAYKGHIDGNGHTIKGLRVLQDISYVGFVAVLYDNASLKNLTIEDAAIKGKSNTGIVGGRSQHGGLIENIHVKSSKIIGTDEVGGIVGRNYRRDKEGVNEDLSFVKDCSIDKNSFVTGQSHVGGICGMNYGAVIMKCTSSATVKGNTYVGGIVGYSRDYYHDANAYVIACGTTADAVISATSKHVGGVVGFNLTDDSHQSAHYVVACYSNAKSITGASNGLISGTRIVNCMIMGSWAEENGNMALCSGENTGYISGSQIFATAASVTAADVQAMNEAIAAFNNLNAEVSCPYIWTWTSGNWPVLTSVEND